MRTHPYIVLLGTADLGAGVFASGAFKLTLPGFAGIDWPEVEGGPVLVAAAGLPSIVPVIGSGETETLPPCSVVPPGEDDVEFPGDLLGVLSTAGASCILTGVACWPVVAAVLVVGISQVRLRT